MAKGECVVLWISVMKKSRDFYCLVNKSASIWERRGICVLSAFHLRANEMFDLVLFLQAF